MDVGGREEIFCGLEFEIKARDVDMKMLKE